MPRPPAAPAEDTPTYWATAASARYIPAAEYLARERQATIRRCRACGQWTWGGVCSLHPDDTQDSY